MKKLIIAAVLCASSATAHAYQQACHKLSVYAREVAIGRYSGIDKTDQVQAVRGLGYQKNVRESLLLVVDGAYKLPSTSRSDFQYVQSRFYADDVYSDCMRKFQAMVK